MLDRTNAAINVLIRRASQDDLGFIRAVARVLTEQHQIALSALGSEWFREINRGAIEVFVATDNNKTIGMVVMTRLPLVRVVEPLAVFVAPAFRRRGVGTQLLRYVLGKAGNATIRVNIQRNNDAARAALRAAGFVVSDIEMMVRHNESAGVTK